MTGGMGALLESPLGMRWTTLATAAAMLGLIGVVRRRPDLAVVSVVAWMGGFEIAFRFFEILRWQQWSGLPHLAWVAAALTAWPLLALALGIRPSPAWMAVTAVAFAVWITTGYDYNLPQTAGGRLRPVRLGPEVENVVAKTAWAMCYLVGAWRLPSSGWPRAGGASPARISPPPADPADVR